MSKNIIIQEGGNGKQFTASKLNTALVGGGSCNWVPEDETQLVSLSVSENGTYTASSEGHYGYSQVTVNVAGGAGGAPGGAGSSIIGTDTDGDTVVSTVEDDGTITTEKQVDRIRIGVMPTKTVYVDGEAIDVTGMTVMGLTTTGTYLKFIPLSEITISPTAADISQVTSTTYTKEGINAVAIDVTTYQPNQYGSYVYPDPVVTGRSTGYITEDVPTRIFFTRYNDGTFDLFACVPIGGSFKVVYFTPGYGQSVNPGMQYTPEANHFGWAFNFYDSSFFESIPESTTNPNGVDFSNPTAVGGTQTITVSWTRPSDGAVLTTTFDITVTESSPTA